MIDFIKTVHRNTGMLLIDWYPVLQYAHIFISIYYYYYKDRNGPHAMTVFRQYYQSVTQAFRPNQWSITENIISKLTLCFSGNPQFGIGVDCTSCKEIFRAQRWLEIWIPANSCPFMFKLQDVVLVPCYPLIQTRNKFNNLQEG